MKKILYLFFTCSIIFAFAGCSPSKKDSASNASVNEKRFYTLKKELDVVDDELDHLDDEFEHAYENGKLSFKVYKSREKTIEKLEDQLDLLEDALENKFGIDD